jgi:hypothetical protein
MTFSILLQLDPDHHCAVDLWYFGPDPPIRTTNSRIWIYIRIRLRIRDILVRIRIRRSEPLQLDPDHHCAVDPWYFGLDPQIRTTTTESRSSLWSVIFWSRSADPTTDSRIWIYIRIQLWICDILVRIRRSEPLAQGSGSIVGSGSGSMIFWSGSADPNHWLKDLDLY